ncbi:MAG TPA: chromosomal replication initiator protein DnaA [Lapidilactobacillus dextrinicus]|uniref:Chromosomal replication initiator protein DnaA n=2 Tax=Lactobacillales TaxID=186826 RepID=A0A921B2P7_9LACO|nr:chromosomal replication initiator protein DnaA [Lapidilactobacillus dextrinicus]HIZ53968.1 chromosomal replication initiator protein DnaA [Candidatus Enterococcus avicola]HJE14796.1 chromosomal replication initiator protein DnaA [Lapidilactobacillus dextrinicus]
MANEKLLWEKLVSELQKNFESVSYDTWIAPVEPISLVNGVLTLELPSAFHRDYWDRNLVAESETILQDYTGQKIRLDLTVPNENHKEDVDDPIVTGVDAPGQVYAHDTHLNDKYTFDSFVVGSGNYLAQAAALSAAEEPGQVYNPLNLYGGVGLGKTHLMQAIGHEVLRRNPEAKVKYVTSEEFANDFINSIRTRRQEEFRREYRSVDLLLVDDIQFFADKEATQEEFFHTFNKLYENKKQIVLTSDRIPSDIPKLEDRLISRFKWGLSADITPPDLETRIAILRNKAVAEGLEIDNQTLNYIAGQIDTNIRELEGALVRVQAYATINKIDITLETAIAALKGLKDSAQQHGLSISKIQEVVAQYYRLQVSDLTGKKRTKNIVVPRQIAMYLSRELTENSLPKIGKEFGGKDHTTVIHAHEKIVQDQNHDSELRSQISDLKKLLKG